MTSASAANVGGNDSNPEMGNRTGSNENNVDKENEKSNGARVRALLISFYL